MYLAIWNLGPMNSTIILGLFTLETDAKKVLKKEYDRIKLEKSNKLWWNKYNYGFEIIRGKQFGIAICSIQRIVLDKETLIYV